MKESRTIKMVEQTEVKFIADDGTEFIGESAERKCRDYERQSNENKVKKEFERLDKKEIKLPFANWLDNEVQIWKVTLNSRADYFRLIDYCKITIGDWNEYFMEEPKSYPYTTIVVTGCEWASEYKKDFKEELQKTLEQLG
jgi:hypothetical protein